MSGRITEASLAKAVDAGLPEGIADAIRQTKSSSFWIFAQFALVGLLLTFILSCFFYFEFAENFLPKLSLSLHTNEGEWRFFSSITDINMIAAVFASIGLGAFAQVWVMRTIQPLELANGFSTLQRLIHMGRVDTVIDAIDPHLAQHSPHEAYTTMLRQISRDSMRILNWFGYVLVPPFFIFLALDLSNYSILTDTNFRHSGYFSLSEKELTLSEAKQVRTGCRVFGEENELSLKYTVSFGHGAEINLFDAQSQLPRLLAMEEFDLRFKAADVPFIEESLSGPRTGDAFTDRSCFERLGFRFEKSKRDQILRLLGLTEEYAEWRSQLDLDSL